MFPRSTVQPVINRISRTKRFRKLRRSNEWKGTIMRSLISSWSKTFATLGFKTVKGSGQSRRKRRSNGHQLHLESLEDRRMMAVATVSNLNDVTNGVTTSIAALIASPGADGISLREALTAANAGSDSDTIQFDPAVVAQGPGTIELENDVLLLLNDVEIIGPGGNLLTIDAQGSGRVFALGEGVEASISGVTITGGQVTGSDRGAGIYVAGDLTLDSVVVAGNIAASLGGGMYVYPAGSLHLIDSTVENNSASDGAGIFAHVDGEGLVISGSTIANNTASSFGGGVMFHGWSNNPTGTIVNSTISGNSAVNSAGIRASSFGHLTIVNSTVTENNATTQQGGGIGRVGGTNVTLHNTIVADNTAPWGFPDIVSWNSGNVTADSSYNLIGDAGNSGLVDDEDFNNVIGASGDPGLAPLGNYGGKTQTHALLATSPAVDQGSNAKAIDASSTALATDQRKFTRVIDYGTTGPSGRTVDIGAFELGAPIIVSTLVDESDGDYSVDDISLREALELAYALPGKDRIEFKTELAGGTIALSGNELYIGSDVDIIGPGADLMTIDAHGVTRVIQVGLVAVKIQGLTITGGFVSGSADGAGIFNSGDLTLDSVVLSDNHAGDFGGGIYVSWTGQLDLRNSTVDSNSATWGGGVSGQFYTGERLSVSGSTISNNVAAHGGGVMFYGLESTSVGTITNSTVSGNSASSSGGMRIANAGELIVTNSTVTNNSATAGQGGGLMRTGWSYVTLHNTIVADNTASGGYPDLVSWNDGEFTPDSSFNLIGDAGNSGLLNGTNGNIVIGAGGEPGLAPLGVYGGTTKSHPLMYGSIAIDGGDASHAITLGTDQRGFERLVNGSQASVALVDIGAVEMQLSGANSGLGGFFGTNAADVITVTDESITINGTTFAIEPFAGITVYALAGDDSMDASATTKGVHLYGNAGNDNLIGGTGHDRLSSGGGDDRLEGGAGDDTYAFDDRSHATIIINDTGGNDTVDVSGWTGPRGAKVNLAAPVGAYQFVSSPNGSSSGPSNDSSVALAFEQFEAIENVIGSRFNDTLKGNSKNNKLISGGGEEWEMDEGEFLDGGAGDDTYVFDDRSDATIIINDIAGNDTIDLSSWIGPLGAQIDLSAGVGMFQFVSSPNFSTVGPYNRSSVVLTFDQFEAIENIIGTPFDDALKGNSKDNVLRGGAGDDQISGGSGADLVDGGLGDDEFLVSTNDDYLGDSYTDPDQVPVVQDQFGNINHPPRIQPIADRVIDAGTTLEFQVVASDNSNPSSLQFTLSGQSFGATLSPSGYFTWSPHWSLQEEEHVTFRVNVTDTGSPSLRAVREFHVTALPISPRKVQAINSEWTTDSVTWDKVDGAAGYVIEHRARGGNWAVIHQGPYVSSYDYYGIFGSTNEYRLKAYNAGGEFTPYSEVVRSQLRAPIAPFANINI